MRQQESLEGDEEAPMWAVALPQLERIRTVASTQVDDHRIFGNANCAVFLSLQIKTVSLWPQNSLQLH